MQVDIHGQVADGFERVEDVFRSLWDDIEVGASFCAYVRGEKVVDLWGGWIDREMTIPWQSSTLINVYSTTKGLASLAFAILVDEGQVSYEDKVIEFIVDKAEVTEKTVSKDELMKEDDE